MSAAGVGVDRVALIRACQWSALSVSGIEAMARHTGPGAKPQTRTEAIVGGVGWPGLSSKDIHGVSLCFASRGNVGRAYIRQCRSWSYQGWVIARLFGLISGGGSGSGPGRGLSVVTGFGSRFQIRLCAATSFPCGSVTFLERWA